MIRVGVAFLFVVSIGCAQIASVPRAIAGPHDALIAKHAAAHGVPEGLVRRVIRIESRGNPRAVSKGNFGLMQIRLGTARAMGYSGTAQGLLDADTNMTYAVKYLASAYRAAGCNESRAISYYQRGFHRAARSKCRVPIQVVQAETNALAQPSARTAREPIVTTPNPSVVNPNEVLRPKVVQTESITKPTAPSAPPQMTAKAEPKTTASRPTEAPRVQTLMQAIALPKPQPAPPVAKAESVASPLAARLEPVATSTQPVFNGAFNTVSSGSFAKPVPKPVPKPEPKIESKSADTKSADTKSTDAKSSDSKSVDAKPEQQPDASQVVAALQPEVVPLPPVINRDLIPAAKQKSRSSQRSKHRRSHASRKAAEQPGLMTLLQKLVTPEKKPRSRRSRSHAGL